MKLTLEGRDCIFLNFYKEPFGDKIPLGGEDDKFEFHWRHLAEDTRERRASIREKLVVRGQKAMSF